MKLIKKNKFLPLLFYLRDRCCNLTPNEPNIKVINIYSYILTQISHLPLWFTKSCTQENRNKPFFFKEFRKFSKVNYLTQQKFFFFFKYSDGTFSFLHRIYIFSQLFRREFIGVKIKILYTKFLTLHFYFY